MIKKYKKIEDLPNIMWVRKKGIDVNYLVLAIEKYEYGNEDNDFDISLWIFDGEHQSLCYYLEDDTESEYCYDSEIDEYEYTSDMVNYYGFYECVDV